MQFSSTAWPDLNLRADHSAKEDAAYFAQLSSFLKDHPAGTLSSLAPEDTILIPPGNHTNGLVEDLSSPESSASSTEQRLAEVSAKNASSTKRKTSGGMDKVQTLSLKDSRRSSHPNTHTHEEQEEEVTTKGRRSGGLSTSEKRKEQNRNAQRAFRERREKHAKELEDRVAELQAAAEEREQENQNLKDLVTRLRSENERLLGNSFTFSMPSSVVPQPTSSASSASDPLFATPSTSSFENGFAAYASANSMDNFMSIPQSFNAVPSFDSTFSDLFAPADSTNFSFANSANCYSDPSNDIFTPSGEHLNPLASLDDMLTTSPPSAPIESALSPGSAEMLFNAYRDPQLTSKSVAVTQLQSATVEKANSPASVCESTDTSVSNGASTPALQRSKSNSVEPAVSTNCTVFRDGLSSLKGAEDYDLDSLCQDMMQKATCKQAAAVALEKALSDDVDIQSFFGSLAADTTTKNTYKKY